MAAQLTIDTLGDAATRALGPRLVALMLYGSAARGTHVPKRSDVNTLLICDAVDGALFDALAPVVRAWTKSGHPAPLIRHAEGGPALRLAGGARDPLVAAYLAAVARTTQYVNQIR